MQFSAAYLSRRCLPVLYFFLLISFSSCLTSRKMDKWIDRQYGSTVPQKMKSSDYITIKTDNLTKSEKVSTTQKGKRKLIPALFYWHWDYSTVSTLNPYIPVSNVSTTIMPYANSKGLRQKLNGQKLELTFDQAPAVFELTEKGNLIFVLVYYIGWENIYIEPKNEEMVVAYRLLNSNNEETKKGVITITNRDQPISLKMFQSPKKMTWRYLEQYNNNIKSMSRELVDKLMLEIVPADNLAKP